jgi:hypothetical protein
MIARIAGIVFSSTSVFVVVVLLVSLGVLWLTGGVLRGTARRRRILAAKIPKPDT